MRPLKRDALVPDSFRDVQWTHLPGGEACQAFVARVAALLGAPVPVATAVGTSPSLVTSRRLDTRDRRATWIRDRNGHTQSRKPSATGSAEVMRSK